MQAHPVILELLALVERTPHPARPILAALLARGTVTRYMPLEIATCIAAIIGVQRQPDVVLSSTLTIAFRDPGDEMFVAAAWSNLRRAPRNTRRAAVRALRALRDAVKIVNRYAAARRQVH